MMMIYHVDMIETTKLIWLGSYLSTWSDCIYISSNNNGEGETKNIITMIYMKI